MNAQTNPLKRFFKGIWGAIDASRRVAVNLLFLLIVVLLLSLVFSSDKVKIGDSTALLVAPKGQLVEQLTASSFEQMIEEARGTATPETLLKDVVDAIHSAKDDDRIKVLVLNLSSFGGARLTKLQDVAEAIVDFKTSGKKVVAVADEYGQDAYYLAAHADEVIIHKMGVVIIRAWAATGCTTRKASTSSGWTCTSSKWAPTSRR